MTGLTPDITAPSVVRHGVLKLQFADGLTGEVDVLGRMLGPVFAEARSSEGFQRARVDVESGTVVWPGGADLAPDTLYERIRTAAGRGESSLPNALATVIRLPYRSSGETLGSP